MSDEARPRVNPRGGAPRPGPQPILATVAGLDGLGYDRRHDLRAFAVVLGPE